MSWRAFWVCVGCGGALACGSSPTNVAGDDAGTDGSSYDATMASDAEGGGSQSTDGTGGDTSSVDGNGSSEGGLPSDASGADGSSSMESGGSDASDAGDGGGIIIVPADSGDDGGSVEGGITIYFPCGPTQQCKVQTQFCFHTAGPTAPDGGVPETWDCEPIPAACEPAPTCACLSSNPTVTNGCPCTTQTGLEIDCLFP